MIINKTKERILAHKVNVCSSVICKAIGLMFHKKIRDFGLVFEFAREKRVSLHNLFVFFPIDIIFLSEKLEIAELKENFRPFTLYMPKNKAKYIIELPAGSISRSRSEIGDTINFK